VHLADVAVARLVADCHDVDALACACDQAERPVRRVEGCIEEAPSPRVHDDLRRHVPEATHAGVDLLDDVRDLRPHAHDRRGRCGRGGDARRLEQSEQCARAAAAVDRLRVELCPVAGDQVLEQDLVRVAATLQRLARDRRIAGDRLDADRQVGLGRVLGRDRGVFRRLRAGRRALGQARHDDGHSDVGQRLLVDLIGEDAAVAARLGVQVDQVGRRDDPAERAGGDGALLRLVLLVAVDALPGPSVVLHLGHVEVMDERAPTLLVDVGLLDLERSLPDRERGELRPRAVACVLGAKLLGPALDVGHGLVELTLERLEIDFLVLGVAAKCLLRLFD
jgi:hypothetical protein